MKKILKIKFISTLICLQALFLSLFTGYGACLPVSSQEITFCGLDNATLAPTLKISSDFFQPAYENTIENQGEIDLNPGVLDGVTLVRFARAYDNISGGVEKHLQNLNETLLARNRMTIIQLYLSEKPEGITKIKIGKGRLIKAPIVSQKSNPVARTKGSNLISKIVLVLEKLRIRSLVQNVMLDPKVGKIIKNIPILRTGYRLVAATSNAAKTKEMINNILEEYDVDLIMLHSRAKPDEIVLADTANERGIPVIFQNHFANSILTDLAVKRFLSKVSQVGGLTATDVPDNLKSSFTVLGNGIDTDFFSADKAKKMKFDFDVPVVLLPARLFPGKGHKDSIRMMRILNKKGVKIKLIFAGDESYPGFKEELINFAGEDLVNDIIFAGELTQEELRDYYVASDITILPSKSEGFGRVLVEAQAMGRPVIAYKEGGMPETMIDGITGYTVEKGKVQKFADKLEELCADPKRRSEMGEKGSIFVRERFSLSALAERHEKLYAKLLKIEYTEQNLDTVLKVSEKESESFSSEINSLNSSPLSSIPIADSDITFLRLLQSSI